MQRSWIWGGVFLLAALCGAWWLRQRAPQTQAPSASAPGAAAKGRNVAAVRSAPGLTHPEQLSDVAAPGGLRLEGLVVDEAGTAVAGAKVQLVGGDARVAGVDGAFAFEGLAQGPVTVFATDQAGAAAGYGRALVGADGAFALVTLRPATAVVVVVQDETGAPLAGATVAPKHAVAASVTTDARGEAVVGGLAPGLAMLAITAQGYAPQRLIARPASGHRMHYRVRLASGVEVVGEVRDDAGRPLAQAKVAAADYEQARELTRSERTGLAVETDAQGRYRLVVAPDAALRLVVEAPSFAPATGPMFIVTSSRFEHPPIQLTGAPALVGEVVNAQGQPVEAVTVTAAHHEAPLLLRTAVTDAQGHFSLEGLPLGNMKIWARGAGGAVDPVEAVLGPQPKPLVLTLAPALAISGRVEGHGPIEGHELLALPASALGPGEASARIAGVLRAITDEEGKFVFTGAREGNYFVRLRSEGAARPIAARAGQRDVVVPLPACASVRARVVTSEQQPVIGRMSLDTEVRLDIIEGDAYSACVPPGRRKVRIYGEGIVQRTVPEVVLVAGDNDLGELQVEAQAVVRGRVVDAAGRGVADAGVASSVADARASTVRSGADGTFTSALGEQSAYAATRDGRVSHGIRAKEGLELVVQPVGHVRGQIAGPMPPQRLRVRLVPKLPGARAVHVDVDPSGAFAALRLPSGAYQAIVESGDGVFVDGPSDAARSTEGVAVTVSPGKVSELRLPAPNAAP